MSEVAERHPRVSIIIDNYNYALYLEEAIRSAIEQTYSNIEVIVVDDGSTDGSKYIIDKYANSGVVKAVYKENGGQASAMNAGFRVCSGDFVVFLDSDDMLKPEAVETAINVWQPDFSKVQWHLEGIDEKSHSMRIYYPPLKVRVNLESAPSLVCRWLEYGSPPQSGNMYSRAFLEEVFPLPEKLFRIGADTPLILSAPFFGRVYDLPYVLGYYRRHSGKTTRSSVHEITELISNYQNGREYLKMKSLCPKSSRALSLTERRLLLALMVTNVESSSYLKRVRAGLGGAFDSLTFPLFTNSSKRIASLIWFLLVGLLPNSMAKELAKRGLPKV